MKLALIRQRFTGYGGAELYVRQLALRLVEQGHEVHVLARQWPTGEAEGLIWHEIKIGRGPSFRRLYAFAREAARLVAEGHYDLVHSFERTYSQDIFRAGDGCHREWLRRRAQARGPWRGRLDRINPRHQAFLDLEKRLFTDPRLKIVLANSKQGAAEIVEHYGLAEEKIRVVYNGLDRARYHPGLREEHRRAVRQELGLREDEPLALFVGSGFARKGLAETIKSLRYGGIKLLAAGRDNTGPYRRLAARLKVADRVIFLGPRLDVDRLYGAADLFVLPSWYEPFSNACLEAMAAGLPVVTTSGTGAAEVIEEGLNGFVTGFPVEAEELAHLMSLAAGLDMETVVQTNQRVLVPFDWGKNINQTLDAYHEIMADTLQPA